jgi:hypothetical protein
MHAREEALLKLVITIKSKNGILHTRSQINDDARVDLRICIEWKGTYSSSSLVSERKGNSFVAVPTVT